jgi:hypothetical protein
MAEAMEHLFLAWVPVSVLAFVQLLEKALKARWKMHPKSLRSKLSRTAGPGEEGIGTSAAHRSLH